MPSSLIKFLSCLSSLYFSLSILRTDLVLAPVFERQCGCAIVTLMHREVIGRKRWYWPIEPLFFVPFFPTRPGWLATFVAYICLHFSRPPFQLHFRVLHLLRHMIPPFVFECAVQLHGKTARGFCPVHLFVLEVSPIYCLTFSVNTSISFWDRHSNSNSATTPLLTETRDGALELRLCLCKNAITLLLAGLMGWFRFDFLLIEAPDNLGRLLESLSRGFVFVLSFWIF